MSTSSHSSRRAVVAALAANLGVFIAKVVGFAVTGSSALLAESLHSLADSGNQLLLLWGAHRAAIGSSPEHPFGRGREHYFWAFIVGLVLFGVGGATSIIEGVRKLTNGSHMVDRPGTALILVAIAAVLETGSLVVGLRAARSHAPHLPFWARLRRSRDADTTIVVLEDSGALAGLGIAGAGLAASIAWSSGMPDAIATILIGVLLCGIAGVLAVQMHALLIGEPATRADLASIRTAIESVDGVSSLLNLRTEHIGPRDLLVCTKVEFGPQVDSVGAAIAAIDEIERRVHAAVPATLTCYVELDHDDPGRRDAAWT